MLEYVINVFRAEKYNQNKTLFLFGSYTIGKERLFLEAAKVLQQKVLVYVCFITSGSNSSEPTSLQLVWSLPWHIIQICERWNSICSWCEMNVPICRSMSAERNGRY